MTSGRPAAKTRPFRVVALCCCVALLITMAVLGQRFHRQSHPPLLALGPPASVSTAGWPPAAGRVPSIPELEGSTLVPDSLRDLRALTLPYRVPVAAWSPAWRYVWPRDAAFAAVAMARTGHLDQAMTTLDFLAHVQGADGEFQARYLPAGSGVPDARGVELDGTGWSLWALAGVLATAEPAQRRVLAGRYRPLVASSMAAITRETSNGTRLPRPTLDYWEVPTHKTSLSTAAVLLAGAKAAADVYRVLADAGAAAGADAAAGRFQAVVLDSFASNGFPRFPGGATSTADLGVSFLLPSFADVSDPSVLPAWVASARVMRRPAGGLAPGGSWRRDGLSWTPTTATYALAASCVDRDTAVRELRWLDRHRTAAGSLPEKVRLDGAPASVVPLSWTAAAVVITVDNLQRGCSTG